jgi:hypothetical protein
MKIVKDLPFGILLVVISLFFLYAVNLYITPKVWYDLPVVVALVTIYLKLCNIGCRLAFVGIEIDTKIDNENKNDG